MLDPAMESPVQEVDEYVDYDAFMEMEVVLPRDGEYL